MILNALYIAGRGQQGWIYSTDGLMSTIPSSCYKDPPKIVVRRVYHKGESDEQRLRPAVSL